MKNRFEMKRLLTGLSFAGLLFAVTLPTATAQDTSNEQKTKRVRVKIFTEVDGRQTVRDTIIELTADFPYPELKELEKFRTLYSNPINRSKTEGEKTEERIIYRSLPSDVKFRTKEHFEILKLGSLAEDVKFIKPAEAESLFFRSDSLSAEKLKMFRFATPESIFKLDTIHSKRILMYRNEDGKNQLQELDRMPFRIDETRELQIEKFRKLLPVSGDSLVTFKRVIIVHGNLAENEKQLLDKNARKEASAGKLKELELEEVDLYPNPNSGIFNLRFEAAKKSNATITILDAVGREVYRENLKNFKGRYQKEIDLSHLSKGMYFLQVVQGKQVFNKKVMLQ